MVLRLNSNDEIDHVLRHIEDIKVKTYDGRLFVPRRVLHNYLTPERIKKLLEITTSQSLKWEVVRTKYLAVFMILLTIDRGIYITHFIRHNHLADAFLPFQNEGNWPSDFRMFFEKFEQAQGEFCAQVLSSDTLDDKDLGEKIVVPIIACEVLKEGDSKTSKVQIHPDYNRMAPVYGSKCTAPPEFLVLKTCRASSVALYENEVRAYTMLRHHKDISVNIAQFYGSWRQGDVYHILLEYVEGGTLEDFFAKDPLASTWDMLGFWSKLLQILDPVCRIHCQIDPESYDKVSHGVHQDIKPHNILVTTGSSSPQFDGTFKLADLGLTYIPMHEVNESYGNRGRDRPGTQMYSAPECFRDEADLFVQRTVRPADCKKDVWSLACVLSEAVVWCVFGSSGLDEYRQLRSKETEILPKFSRTAYNGCFHDGTKVLSAVQEMHVKVRKGRRACDQIIIDVVPIIDEMFREVNQRPDALACRDRFRSALETAQLMAIPELFQVSSFKSSPASGSGSRSSNGLHELSIDSLAEGAASSPNSRTLARNLTHPVTRTPNGRLSQAQHSSSTQPLIIDHWSGLPRSTNQGGVINSSPRTLEFETATLDGQNGHCMGGPTPIFVIDSSASMRKYRKEVRETLQALAYVVKKLDRDGMDVYFTTSSMVGHGNHTTGILSKFDKVTFGGETYMEITLGKILTKCKSKRWVSRNIFKRGEDNWGKSIYVLTDGKWHGEDGDLCGIPDIIRRVSKDMKSRATLGIQFIQFGNDPVGGRRLEELDDGLDADIINRDIVDTERHDGNVYKMLLGHLSSTWDKATSHPSNATLEGNVCS
ncbi:hypothetical protein GQ44DRAFT_691570 [Phaeosphaeriaceae sp. PMI808]|nr:hypothetical protein GQ44DRAFT_691570 [Phaeosphaeriaceae sp. PMI808]